MCPARDKPLIIAYTEFTRLKSTSRRLDQQYRIISFNTSNPFSQKVMPALQMKIHLGTNIYHLLSLLIVYGLIGVLSHLPFSGCRSPLNGCGFFRLFDIDLCHKLCYWFYTIYFYKNKYFRVLDLLPIYWIRYVWFPFIVNDRCLLLLWGGGVLVYITIQSFTSGLLFAIFVYVKMKLIKGAYSPTMSFQKIE